MDNAQYSSTAKWLHWLTALFMIVAFYLGWVMVDMHGITPTKLKYFNWHKWIGILALGLAVLRSLWRVWKSPPRLPDSISAWQKRASSAMHHLLYVFGFLVPLSGYVYTLAAGYPVVLFGVLPLPVFMAPNPDLKGPLEEVHALLSYGLGISVVLHAAAALQHHFWYRDDVLRRMLPQFSDKSS